MEKLKIKTSKDVAIRYSELCDCDEIYIITIGRSEFQVSYRYYAEMPEPQIWWFIDNKEILICTTGKLPKASKPKRIKELFIAFLLGAEQLEMETIL